MLKNEIKFSKFKLLKYISTFLFKSKTTLVCTVILIAFNFSLVLAQDIGAPTEPVKKIIAKAKELKAAGKIDEVQEKLDTIYNGFPNIYWVDAKIIKELKPRRD